MIRDATAKADRMSQTARQWSRQSNRLSDLKISKPFRFESEQSHVCKELNEAIYRLPAFALIL